MESCHSNSKSKYLEGEKCFQVIILTFAHHLPMVSHPQTFYTQPQWGVYFVALEAFFLNVKAFYLKCPKCPHSIAHPVGQSPHYCAVNAVLLFLLSLGHIAESHFSHMQNLDYSGYFLRGSRRCRSQHLSVAPAAAIGHCLAEASLLFLSQMEV